jgi:hypothetical protein
MMWVLFLLVLGCVIGVFVWDYRKKAARRESARKERFDQIFRKKAGAAPPEAASAAAVQPAVAPATEPAGFSARERFLDRPQALVYLLLKTGMPEHQVFANVTLASVVSPQVSGFDRQQQERRLAACRLGFVVCDREMRIVAVVEVGTPGGGDPSGMERYKSDCLKAAGVRQVCVDPSALPSREALRMLVGGGTGIAGK